MDWIDYREKLGIGFSDNEKFMRVVNYIDNVLSKSMKDYDDESLVNFCLYTGLNHDYPANPKIDFIVNIFRNTKCFNEFLSYYIAFINTYIEVEYKKNKRENLYFLIQNAMNQFHIPFELFKDNNEYFIFPKGARELDNALVSDILIWLNEYPKAKKTFISALKQYSEKIYIRDVADNLRKAFEEFLKEFLGNDKNLDNNKNEVGRYLKSNNAEPEIATMFIPLIGAYNKLNNEIAKHNDKVDEKFLEFLLYQTGLFMRMLIIVKNSELMDGE